jgi:hypothetical protein
MKSVEETLKEAGKSILHTNKLLADITRSAANLESLGVLTRGECIETASRGYAKMRDAGKITHDEFIEAVSEITLVDMDVPLPAATAAVTSQKPAVTDIPFDKLLEYVTEYLTKVMMEKELTDWAVYLDSLDPEKLWGSGYMSEFFGKTMLKTMLPNVIKPLKDKEPTEENTEFVERFTPRYKSVVLPMFKEQYYKYNKRKIPAGIDNLSSKLNELASKIEEHGGSGSAPRDLVVEERSVRKFLGTVSNIERAARAIYRHTCTFFAYLELMDIKIGEVTTTKFSLYQRYLSDNYKRTTGTAYYPRTWNSLRSYLIKPWDYIATREEVEGLKIGLIEQVATREKTQATMKNPPNPFVFKFNDDLTIARRSDEVLNIYRCIRDCDHPQIAKHRDLIEICFRLVRETGLRAKHIEYLEWGRLPKKDTKPVTRAKPVELLNKSIGQSNSLVYPIFYSGTANLPDFKDVAAKKLKGVPRGTGLISQILRDKILQYRKDHPDLTKDDYRVFSGKTLFKDWIDDYVTPLQMSHKLEKGKQVPRDTRLFYNRIVRTLQKWCRDNRPKHPCNMLQSSFRDSFMTLIIEAMFVGSATSFSDVTGDMQDTAVENYRGSAHTIHVPGIYKTKMSYAEIVALVFNNETITKPPDRSR